MPKTKRILEVPAKTKIDENAKHRAIHTLAMDFTDCSRDDLMQPAARSLRIDWQRLYRANPELYPEGTVVEINVKDMISGGVGIEMTKERALAYLKTLPDEVRAILAKQLLAKSEEEETEEAA